MEQIIEVALWIGGIFLLIITGLLTWIGSMHKETKKVIMQKNVEQDTRLDKHDEKFETVQEDIQEIQLQNRETLTIIKHKLKIK